MGRLPGARRIWPPWKCGCLCQSLEPHWEAKPGGDALVGLGCICTLKSQIWSHIPGAGPQPGGSDEPPAAAASPPGAVLQHGDGTPGWAQVWGGWEAHRQPVLKVLRVLSHCFTSCLASVPLLQLMHLLSSILQSLGCSRACWLPHQPSSPIRSPPTSPLPSTAAASGTSEPPAHSLPCRS